MGKQNGKKVSQKQRSQKKSSSLKKYKKKGGSSQKGGLVGYRYQLLVGKEEGGMTGTREGFISDIFKKIKNGIKFEEFSESYIERYTKQKVLNEQYSDEDVIQNIIVPYFFTLPGTTFEGQVDETKSAEEGQEEAETESAGEGKKPGMFSRIFGSKQKNQTAETKSAEEGQEEAETESAGEGKKPGMFSRIFGSKQKSQTAETKSAEEGQEEAETPEQKTSTELDCNALSEEECHNNEYCSFTNDKECMPRNRVNSKGNLIPVDKCEGVQQTNADATFKKAVCNREPGCTWDETENCVPIIRGGTLKETPTIPENTKKGLGIADNVEISAFQYAILKGNYDLVNGIFYYMGQNNGGSLLKKYVEEPLAKSNGTDISLTQPYYLPFTQGYYTENMRLLIGTSNVTVVAEIMQQFVDLFKKYAPDYTSIKSQIGGDGDLTYDEVVNAPVVKPLLEEYYTNLKKENMPDDKQENKKADLENKINTYIDEVNNGEITKEVAMKMVENTLRDKLNLSTDLSDSESDSEGDNEGDSEGDNEGDEQKISQALVKYEGSSQTSSNPSTYQSPIPSGSKISTCVYKHAPQCDSTRSKEENEELKVEYESNKSFFFNPADNRGCDPNKSIQQISDSVTGPARANAINNCDKVIRSQGPETTAPTMALETTMDENESGPQQNTELKAITDGSTELKQTGVGENEDESGPQQDDSTPVSSNTEINDLIELLKTLASQGKIPKVSFDNNELRIVSASSADQQLGDQPVIEVDLTKSAKQLNITYLKEDNTEDTIKIVLYGPKTAEEIAQEELRLENLRRLHE